MMRTFTFILLLFSGSSLCSQTCTLYIDSAADCGLTCIGTATAYPTGQAPFTYLWQPGGQTTQQIANLCPGSYTVTVTDSVGCIITDSVTINGSPTLNVWISSATNPSCSMCSDGSATGSVNGGTPPYYPYWSPPIGFGLYTVNSLVDGTYTFCVDDVNGCTSCVDTLIQYPLVTFELLPTVEKISTVELFDVAGRMVWSGSYSEWLLPSQVALPPATYILIGLDESGAVLMRKMTQILPE